MSKYNIIFIVKLYVWGKEWYILWTWIVFFRSYCFFEEKTGLKYRVIFFAAYILVFTLHHICTNGSGQKIMLRLM